MVASIPLPEGVPLHAASLEQTPLVVQQVVVQLLAVIGQQAERIKALDRRLATLEAQGQRNSSNSDRPPSSDPPWVRAKTTGETKRTPGARPGHPGHRQAVLEPTEVIAVRPAPCPCGQTDLPATTPYYTHQGHRIPALNHHLSRPSGHARSWASRRQQSPRRPGRRRGALCPAHCHSAASYVKREAGRSLTLAAARLFCCNGAWKFLGVSCWSD